MPTKSKQYEWVTFPESVITQAVQAIVEALPPEKTEWYQQTLSITQPSNDRWVHDTDEEFFADYRQVSKVLMCRLGCRPEPKWKVFFRYSMLIQT